MNVRGIYCKIELDGRVRTLIFLCEVKKKSKSTSCDFYYYCTWILIIVFEISFICELFLWKEN